MAKRATRRNKRVTSRKGRGFVSRAIQPGVFVLNAAKHVVTGVAKTAAKLAKHTFKGAKNIGNKVATSANNAINKTIGSRKRTTRRK